MIRRFGPLLLTLLSVVACQTSPVADVRTPSSATEAEWSELVTDDPSTYLDVSDTKRRLFDRKRQRDVLEKCGAPALARPGRALDADLLFIRLESWPFPRLENEYRDEVAPQNLRCLADELSSAGV